MLGIVKINPFITIELTKGNEKITIDSVEAKQIIKELSKFVRNDHYREDKAPQIKALKKEYQKTARKNRRLSKKILYMSDAKRKEILQHINKQVSTRPKTLSNLLKGTSYVPNHLPHIRRMVENQQRVAKKMRGKRTLYYRK